MKEIPKLEQGDLLFVNLTGCSVQTSPSNLTSCSGLLLVTEVSTEGKVISANFCPKGQNGYGQVMWPEYKVKAFLRGTHGECSPFAALSAMFTRSVAWALVET